MKTNLVIMFVVAAALVGCHNQVNSVENAQKEGQRNMVLDQRVVNDIDLGRSLSVVGVNTAVTPGGLLKMQVELLNRTWSRQRFTYRIEWFDANGMQVNSLSAAVLADQIEGGESKFITAIAPDNNCRDFRLKLLGAR